MVAKFSDHLWLLRMISYICIAWSLVYDIETEHITKTFNFKEITLHMCLANSLSVNLSKGKMNTLEHFDKQIQSIANVTFQ